MSLRSQPFGALRLSGEDAVCFERQLRLAKPNPAARAAAKRGRVLLEQFLRDGYAVVKPKPGGGSTPR